MSEPEAFSEQELAEFRQQCAEWQRFADRLDDAGLARGAVLVRLLATIDAERARVAQLEATGRGPPHAPRQVARAVPCLPRSGPVDPVQLRVPGLPRLRATAEPLLIRKVRA